MGGSSFETILTFALVKNVGSKFATLIHFCFFWFFRDPLRNWVDAVDADADAEDDVGVDDE